MNDPATQDPEFAYWRTHCAAELARIQAKLEPVCGFCCEPCFGTEPECRHCGSPRGKIDE